MRLSAIKKLLRVFYMMMDMRLLKFDIYQGGAANCFKSHTYFFKKKICMVSGQKFTLSDATSLLPDNLCGLKKKKKKYIYIYIYIYIC